MQLSSIFRARFLPVVFALVLLMVGVSLTMPMAASAATASTTSVETFEGGAAPWQRILGTATVSDATSPDEGFGALNIDYDLAAGTAEVGKVRTPTSLSAKPFSSVNFRYRGDGTYNTLYLRLRDATGESFLYRVANLNTKTWQTGTVDLKKAPAATLGGNADGILDAPISLYRFSVAKNPGQVNTGSVSVDDLRITTDGWTLPAATTPKFVAGSAGTDVRFESGTAGDFAVTFDDNAGHTLTRTGTAGTNEAIALSFPGKDAAGANFVGSISATLAYDNSPDGTLATTRVRAADPYFAGATAKTKDTKVGSIAGVNSAMTTYDSAAKVESDARLMESANLTYAREEFDWNRIEPRKGYFEWAKFDQAVEIADAHNVELIGKLVYSAAWASSAPAGTAAKDVGFYPPAKLTDYTDYVASVVRRYKDTVNVWEVWNEPNIQQYWKPAPDASAYAEMLKATYSTIKAIDPDSTVLTAGFAGMIDGYMNQLVAAGAGQSYDGLAIHTYVIGAPESSISESWISGAKNFNARNNPSASVWITETAWSSCTACANGVSEELQAQYLSRAYLDAANRGVRGITWFSLREVGTSGSSIDNYGLVTADGTKKPAYDALASTAYSLSQSTGGGDLAPTSQATSTLISDMNSTTGWKSSSIGGGSATIAASSQKHSGAGSLKFDYNWAGSGTGGVISTSLPVPGTPTALSLWAYGDKSNTSVYLKFADATGETFEAKVGNVGGNEWERLTFYFDGLNPNYTVSGGDGDKTIDYPIKITNMHLYEASSGVNVGQIYLDDLSAHYGTIVRGTMLMGRNLNIQAAYTATTATTTLPVAGTVAYDENRGSLAALPVSGGKATVTLSAKPKFVVSAIRTSSAAAQKPTTVHWQGADRTSMTVQVITASGVLVRTLSDKTAYDAGARSVTWDGKKSNGTWAAKGDYKFRVQTYSPDGRSSVLTRDVKLT